MRHLTNILWFGFLAVLLVSGDAEATNAPTTGKIGIVLMHGKDGDTHHLVRLAEGLERAGFYVETPLMPWSSNRIFDRTYDDSMLEIDAAAGRLLALGADRIVVGGHSIGAHAAVGYAARRDGLAGVVLLGYGHVPSGWFFTQELAASVALAKSMIDAGNGGETATFDDINQRRRFRREMTAEIYYSWFAPDGPASNTINAANVNEEIPALWISGDEDAISGFGRNLVWNRIPYHPKNKFVVIRSDHRSTPKDAISIVIEWLEGL